MSAEGYEDQYGETCGNRYREPQEDQYRQPYENQYQEPLAGPPGTGTTAMLIRIFGKKDQCNLTE